jgi:transcriptional regulator with XRE-family HTH domain
MHPGERIKQRRKELGLSAEALAEHAGTTDMSYRDVEAYESEFKDMLDLAKAKAKRICDLLRLDLFEVLALDPEVPRELLEAASDRGGLGRGEFIRAHREAIGLSA